MATVTRTFMVDDIDGSRDDVSTVQIALDNVYYEIDLSTDNAAQLREKLARFVDNGKRVTTHPRAGRRRPGESAQPPRSATNRRRRSGTGRGTTATQFPSGDAFLRMCKRRSTTHTE